MKRLLLSFIVCVLFISPVFAAKSDLDLNTKNTKKEYVLSHERGYVRFTIDVPVDFKEEKTVEMLTLHEPYRMGSLMFQAFPDVGLTVRDYAIELYRKTPGAKGLKHYDRYSCFDMSDMSPISDDFVHLYIFGDRNVVMTILLTSVYLNAAQNKAFDSKDLEKLAKGSLYYLIKSGEIIKSFRILSTE